MYINMYIYTYIYIHRYIDIYTHIHINMYREREICFQLARGLSGHHSVAVVKCKCIM